jgi:putative hemolysin
LFGIDPKEKDKEVTEEEIRMMVDVGSETGGIENSEKEMIQNIFEFNDKEVSEIMKLQDIISKSQDRIVDIFKNIERISYEPFFK